MPDAQNPDDVVGSIEHVQPEIPGISPRNDQLANLRLDSAADERVVCQDGGSSHHRFDHPGRRVGRLIEKEFGEPFEVGKRLGRKDYLRHFTGLGRFAFWPRAFART